MGLEIKVGVFGAGVISNGHIENFCSCKYTDVICLVDVNETLARKTADKYSVPHVETDYKTTLDKHKLDLVLVATPQFLHHRMVVDSLKSGSHVICEKPPGMTVAECDEMIAAANENNKRLFVGHNMRMVPEFRKIKKIVDSKRIGRIFMADFQYLGHEIEQLSDPNNWKGTTDRSGGGVLMDGGCHMVDLMLSCFGIPVAVSSLLQRSVIEAENKEEDNALIQAEYPGRLMVNLLISFTAKTKESNKHHTLMLRMAMYGTEGSIVADCTSANGWNLLVVEDDSEQNFDTSDIEQINLDHHFVDCILNNKEPMVTVQQARNTIAIIEAAYCAHREKRRIEL